MSEHCNEENVTDIMSFIFQPPCDCGKEDCDCDDQIITMDCNDYCEQLPQLAERVAAGENLGDILPRLQQHMELWEDCREEFEALVAIIRAEKRGDTQAVSHKE